MRALASQGIFATDCYEQLKSILLQKLGPDHAALLAEPQHNAEGNSVDWYAEGNGPAVPLAELSEQDAQALRARAGNGPDWNQTATGCPESAPRPNRCTPDRCAHAQGGGPCRSCQSSILQ